jgi:hypothetical protein
VNWYKLASRKTKDKEPLTTKEREQVKSKFGNDLECSFAKDSDGYFCYTHRARSDSYKTIEKVPEAVVRFIESTG